MSTSSPTNPSSSSSVTPITATINTNPSYSSTFNLNTTHPAITIEEQVLNFLNEHRENIEITLPTEAIEREVAVQAIGRLIHGVMDRQLIEIADSDGAELLSLIGYLKTVTGASGHLLTYLETNLKNALSFSTLASAKRTADSAALKREAEWHEKLRADHELKARRIATEVEKTQDDFLRFSGSSTISDIPSGGVGSTLFPLLATGVTTGVTTLSDDANDVE